MKALVFLARPRLPAIGATGWVRLAGVLWQCDETEIVVWCSASATREARKRWWNVAVCTLDAAGCAVPLAFCRNRALLERLARRRGRPLNLPAWLLFRGRYKRMPVVGGEVAAAADAKTPVAVASGGATATAAAATTTDTVRPTVVERPVGQRARAATGAVAVAAVGPATGTTFDVDAWDAEVLADADLSVAFDRYGNKRDMVDVCDRLGDARTERLRRAMASTTTTTTVAVVEMDAEVGDVDATALTRPVAASTATTATTTVTAIDDDDGDDDDHHVVAGSTSTARCSSVSCAIEPTWMKRTRRRKRRDDYDDEEVCARYCHGDAEDEALMREYFRRKRLCTYARVDDDDAAGGGDGHGGDGGGGAGGGGHHLGRWYLFPPGPFYQTLKREYGRRDSARAEERKERHCKAQSGGDLDEGLLPGYKETVERLAAGLPPPQRPFLVDWRRLGVTGVDYDDSGGSGGGGSGGADDDNDGSGGGGSGRGGRRRRRRRYRDDLPLAVLQYRQVDGRHAFAACDAAGIVTLVQLAGERASFSEVFQASNGLWATAIPLDHDQALEDHGGGADHDAKETRQPFCVDAWTSQATVLTVEALTRTWPCLADAVAVAVGAASVEEQGTGEKQRKKRLTDDNGILRLHAWNGSDRSKISLHGVAHLAPNVVVAELGMLSVLWKTMRALVQAQPVRFDALCDDDGKCLLDCDGLSSLRLPGCSKRLDDGSLVRRLRPVEATSTVLDALVHYPHGDVPPLLDGGGRPLRLYLRAANAAVTVGAPTLRAWPWRSLWRDAPAMPGRFKKQDRDEEEGEEGTKKERGQCRVRRALRVATRRFGVAFDVKKTTDYEDEDDDDEYHCAYALIPASRTERDRYCAIKGALHRRPKMFLMLSLGYDDGERLWIHCRSAKCKATRAALPQAPSFSCAFQTEEEEEEKEAEEAKENEEQDTP